MLEQVQLFDNSERLVLDRAILDEVALPVGDNYGDELFTGYLADYAGMARKYKPKRVFEIGVRYGYIAMWMQLGMRKNRGAPSFEYIGIDDESYHPCLVRANENFKKLCPWAKMEARRYNSITQGIPPDVGTFDFIHIDGNHDYHGVANDLAICWPILNPGGIILLDDARATDDNGKPGPIFSAIQDFLGRFTHTPELVEWQYQVNDRCHVYIRKSS